jgi:hypothetical protein
VGIKCEWAGAPGGSSGRAHRSTWPIEAAEELRAAVMAHLDYLRPASRGVVRLRPGEAA